MCRAAVCRAAVGHAALLAGLPLAVLGACAGPSSYDVPLGGGPSDAGPPSTPYTVLRCGEGAIVCGGSSRNGTEGCCPAGNKCTPEGTCAPAGSCTTNADCSSDSVCGGNLCHPWSDLTVVNGGFDQSCRDGIDLPSLKPVEQCHWPVGNAPPQDFPDSVQVIATPMVADFDFDNDPTTHHPSIVFISYADLSKTDGVLRVIDGKDCSPQFSTKGELPLLNDVPPALGDVDGDKRPDIVFGDLETLGTGSKAGVVVYTPDGHGTPKFKLLARQTGNATKEFTRISLYDADGLPDGLPEILTDTGMFGFKSGVSGGLSGVVKKADLADANLLEPPIVRDINGDRIAEIITPTGIFNWDEEQQAVVSKKERGADLWNPYPDQESASFIGMANLGDFTTATRGDSVEMVVVQKSNLLVVQVDGRILLNIKGSGIVGGPPVIADFDGDGRMEFASPGLDQISAFDLDCSDDEAVKGIKLNCKNPKGQNPQALLWTKTGLQGATSGASVFDFDGDTRSEVVYADQCYLRILNGLTGDVLFSVPRSSTTRFDYPLIVDSDGDGHTEIVTAANDATDNHCPTTDPINQQESVSFRATHGITVWSDAVNSADKRWAGSRAIWNQYTYSISNVNDDGTVPAMNQVASQWNQPELDPNSLRQNVQGKTGISIQRADLTVSASPAVQCARNQPRATLSVNLCNRGLLDVAASSVNVKMAPDSAPGSALCEVANKTVLRSGKCEPVTCDVAVPTRSSDFDIRVWADSGNAVAECTEGMSNTALITNVFCTPTLN
jgi:hypothetical protein